MSGLPSRRFREAQLLIVAALALLFAMVLVEMQGMLALARAAEREALRGVESAATLVGAELSAEHGLLFQAPPREGLGDGKFLAMIGAFLGWKGALLTIGLGSVFGAVVGLGLIAAGSGRRDTELPFGTFLALGALVTLFAGAPLMRLLGWIRP